MTRVSLAACFFLALVQIAGAAPAARPVSYERDIQPLLKRRCYACHSGSSAGSASARAGLVLNVPGAWLRGGNSGAAVVPHDPDHSVLIRAVRHTDGVPAMPPGARLTDAEIALLTDWIRAGAPSPKPPVEKWWAFQPVRPVRPPVVKDDAWSRTPIDRFILAKLRAKGLRPSPPADRRALIRRATYDLTGLPPTPEEVSAFLADRSPDAYEKVVDRLLASPRYGERWGRHWLDVAHYADTHGYDKDKRRDHAWPYRDYVVRSFNADKPYGRFLKEQVAGDALYPADPDATVATGFVAAGPWDFVGEVELAEGTVEKQKTRLLDRDDMVATTISTFNSLTVHCARCHDHKFDPIPQRDYYRLQAVFAGVDRGDRPYGAAAVIARQLVLQGKQRELKERLAGFQRQADQVQSPELERLEASLKALKEQVAALPPTGASPSNGYHSGIEARPDVEKWVQVDLGREVPIDEIGLVPARPTDFPDTPGFGFPARFRVAVSDDPTFARSEVLEDHTAADFPNPAGAKHVVRAGGRKGRYVRVTATKLWPRTNDYVFALGELLVISGGHNTAAGAVVTALDSIEAGRWSQRYLVDNFDSRALLPEGLTADLEPALRRRSALLGEISALERARSAAAQALVPDAVRAGIERTTDDLGKVEADLKALPALPQVYALVSHQPRPVQLLSRGDVEQPRGEMTPGALSCISGLSADFRLPNPADEGSRRAALAGWLASPSNPLTWRSIVNRVWHYHFGRGIVDTPNDFGRHGSRPTHPELLDWLAGWFTKSGQSVKNLHRMIMLSAVYRQASRYRPECARTDADDRFLWRMNQTRLEAEALRDAVLAVSGKLDLKMGGPAFELFRFKDDHSPVYDFTAADRVRDPATWRRTIYGFTVRSVPNPFLESLDCADPNINTPVRNSTLTALQALALLNDPFMIQQSGFLAERLRAHSADLAGQIDYAYRLLFGRSPRPDERVALVEYVGKHGLPNACRLLLNTNEFVFID